MAYTDTGFSQVSASMSGAESPTPFAYELLTDTLATIKASAYFNTKSTVLNISDSIYIVGSDGADIVRVTAVTPDVTVTSVIGSLPAGSVGLADLEVIIAPIEVVKLSGTFTTAGGDVNETISIAGILATDRADAQVKVLGAVPVQLNSRIAGTDKIDLVFSADPSTDHQISWAIFRATS